MNRNENDVQYSLPMSDHYHDDELNRLGQSKGKEKAEIIQSAIDSYTCPYGNNGNKGSTESTELTKDKNTDRNTLVPLEYSEDEFPLDVYPKWISEFIMEHHSKSGFPTDYTAAGVLAMLSFVCGNNRVLKHQFEAKGLIWIALVGKTGVNKTHPLNSALKPLKVIDKRLFHVYNQQMKDFNSALKKSKPPKPKLNQLTVNDATMEALEEVLSNNPDGVILHKDELAGWFKEMDSYRQRGDLEHWCSLYNHQTTTINRVGRGPLFIKEPYVTVVGTIQPAALKRLSPDGAIIHIGFLDRFLFVWPEVDPPSWKTNSEIITSEGHYGTMMLKILKRQCESKKFEFSPDAIKRLIEWQTNLLQQYQPADDLLQGIAAKLQTYAYRLALLLHIAHNPEDPPNYISVNTINKTIKLLNYFDYQAKKIRIMILGSDPLLNFNETQKKFYRALPNEFSAAMAKDLANNYEIPSRTTTDLLKRFRQAKLIKKKRHGKYEKVAQIDITY